MATITRNGAYDLEECNKIIVRGEEIVVLISDDWNIQDVTIYPFNRFYTDEIKELNIRIVKKGETI